MDTHSFNINEFRKSGHDLIDMLSDYLQQVEDKNVFSNEEPAFIYSLFDERIPESGESLNEVIQELNHKLLPYCTQVNHPGYMGLITPTPTPAGILGDLIASALNQNAGAYTIGPSAVAMERQVIRWINELIGYDTRSGGNLTSGGMTANFIGLKLARDFSTSDMAQYTGITQKLSAYVSEERHVSIDKAADAIGIGRNNLRLIPTNENYQVRVDLLEEGIRQDISDGIKPICIIALAGTTNTGSVDDLHSLSAIAQREKIWLHADAAYGGGMLISQKYKGLLNGLELADSVTLDPHKWFYAPLDAGAILVKDESRLTHSFGMQPAYLTNELDIKNERYNYYVHGFEQSRRFRSLKVWMSFKRYGINEIGNWVDKNVEQATGLFELCKKMPDFIPATKPLMSAICIRYTNPNLSAAQLNTLHAEVIRKIEESGKFWISTTIMKGYTWFRINPVNFRTEIKHIEALFSMLKKECAVIAEKIFY